MNNEPEVSNFQRAVYRMQTEVRFVTIAMYLMQMQIVARESVRTAATDCVRKIWYAPSYFAAASVELCMSALVHEVYHKFLNFFPRFERWAKLHPDVPRKELLDVFNRAQDYFINWIIKHEWGLPLMDGWLYDPRCNPMSHTTESIANELLKNPSAFQPPSNPGAGAPEDSEQTSAGDDSAGAGSPPADEPDTSDDPADKQATNDDGNTDDDDAGGAGGAGDDEGDAPDDAQAGAGDDIMLPDEYAGDIDNVPSEQEIQEMELDNAAKSHNAERMTQPMRGISEGRGEPDPFIREIERSQYRATFGWRQQLSRYAESNGPTSFSYSRRSRRSVARNQPIRPGKVGKELGKIVFVIDSSGSTSGQAISYALAELQHALDSVQFDEAVVIWCSDDIPPEGVFSYKPGDTIDTRRRKCGGGTHFMPAFERIAKEHSDCAVISYLTDGGVSDYEVREVNDFWRTRLGMKPLLWGLVNNGWGCTDKFIVKANRMGLGKTCVLPMEKM